MRYIKLYFLCMKMNLKTMGQYKTDFFIGALSTLLMQISSLIFLWAIFENINTFAGWTFYEVVFVYGIFTVCRGLNHMFFDNLWIIGKEFIRRGTFDILLIRPAGTLFQIIAQKFQVDGIGTFVLGVVVSILGYSHLGISVGIGGGLLIFLFTLLGTGIIAVINLIFSVSSFWTVRSNNIIWMVFSLADFAQYPLTIYHPVIRFILTYIIPYGFVSYYPISFILKKGSVKVVISEIIVLSVLCLIAKVLWSIGKKKYESAGN